MTTAANTFQDALIMHKTHRAQRCGQSAGHTHEHRDRMFIVNVNHQDLFLRGRPYRGEPPTVAGFLLYPDSPAKMESTSREAFCFKVIPQRVRGKAPGNHLSENTQQESHRLHPTSSRQTGRGNGSSRDSERGRTAASHEADTAEMQSQYQKDFPPPSSSCCCRRRTPVLPQPDNIGINPAFRIDFNTVQRQAFPGWSTVKPGCDITGVTSQV